MNSPNDSPLYFVRELRRTNSSQSNPQVPSLARTNLRGLSTYKPNGLTIVEMLIVIVIVGILAVVAFARIIEPNSFNASIVRDQIISLGRVAQQGALGRPGVSLSLTPNGAGDTLTIDFSDSGGTIESAVIDLDGVDSFAGDVNTTASCGSTPGATAITNAAPMTLNFDELGDLTASGFGAGTAVTSAVRICINDDAQSSVCVSPAGFVYAGDCDV